MVLVNNLLLLLLVRSAPYVSDASVIAPRHSIDKHWKLCWLMMAPVIYEVPPSWLAFCIVSAL